MSVAANLARGAPRFTRATGTLLVLLGLIHLIATPFYIGWSAGQLRPDHASQVIAGMRLNHILVGILLIPLGLSTCWAAKALPQAWALRLATMNAIVLFCLPLLLVATMPRESLSAPLFLAAIVVLVLACLCEILALGGVWHGRNERE